MDLLGFRKPHTDDVLLANNPSENVTVCKRCGRECTNKELEHNHYVCVSCGFNFRMPPDARIGMLTDHKSFNEMYSNVKAVDFMDFPKYQQKLDSANTKTGEKEGVVVGTAKIDGIDSCIFCMDTRFVMASLGCAMGEKITRIFEYATQNSLPVVGIIASGGARMQEGTLSLLQMAKCSGAIKNHSQAGNAYIALLTDPTTGGVTASIGMLADVIFAEPEALIGFAGRRVIEQTTGEKLPEDFQSSEFMLRHGFVDAILHREEQKIRIADLLKIFERK